MLYRFLVQPRAPSLVDLLRPLLQRAAQTHCRQLSFVGPLLCLGALWRSPVGSGAMAACAVAQAAAALASQTPRRLPAGALLPSAMLPVAACKEGPLWCAPRRPRLGQGGTGTKTCTEETGRDGTCARRILKQMQHSNFASKVCMARLLCRHVTVRYALVRYGPPACLSLRLLCLTALALATCS